MFSFSITLLLIATLGVGCGQPTTSDRIDKLQAETKAAAKDFNDYTFDQKAQFTKEMKAQLAEINQDAYASFKDGVHQSRQWLSDKLAP